MGSMNFGLFPMLDRYKEFKYEWEREHLENSRDFIFRNTFKDIELILTELGDGCGTRFEFECYDVGHLFAGSFAGVAGLGVVCSSFKGMGNTGLTNPVGDPFDVDYFSHELGHPFGGQHPHTGAECNAYWGVEPGSGSTHLVRGHRSEWSHVPVLDVPVQQRQGDCLSAAPRVRD